MKKLSILLCCLLLFLTAALPVLAVDESLPPATGESLYEWAHGLWYYIFPTEIVAANADLFMLFTFFAVSLIVFVPLFVVFCGLIFAFGSFFRRR